MRCGLLVTGPREDTARFDPESHWPTTNYVHARCPGKHVSWSDTASECVLPKSFKTRSTKATNPKLTVNAKNPKLTGETKRLEERFDPGPDVKRLWKQVKRCSLSLVFPFIPCTQFSDRTQLDEEVRIMTQKSFEVPVDEREARLEGKGPAPSALKRKRDGGIHEKLLPLGQRMIDLGPSFKKRHGTNWSRPRERVQWEDREARDDRSMDALHHAVVFVRRRLRHRTLRRIPALVRRRRRRVVDWDGVLLDAIGVGWKAPNALWMDVRGP